MHIKRSRLGSPRTQLTKVQIEISVRGRRTEAKSGYTTYIQIGGKRLDRVMLSRLALDPTCGCELDSLCLIRG